MTFKHGVYVQERATKVSGEKSVDSAIPVVFGTAPKGKLQTPVVVRSYAEAVAEFGFSTDFNNYTLCEFIDCHFTLYKQSYAILVNVADVTTAKKTETKSLNLSQPVTVTDIQYPLVDTVKLKKGGKEVATKDVTASVDSDGFLVITLSEGSAVTLPATDVTVTYETFDMTKVKPTALIGAIDASTGKKTGFELLDDIIPTFGVVPGLVLAPKHATDPTIAAAMSAKAQNMNGMFKALTLIDVDTKKYKTKQQAIAAKKVGDAGEYMCWPMVQRNGRNYHMSTHMAGVIGKMDAENNGIPSHSPSNRAMQVDGCICADGTPVLLGANDANELNGQGIATVLSFIGGPRAWGNRTAAYPNATDMKDGFVHARRMMFWMNNWVISDTWKEVDASITRRFIQAMAEKHNMRLNSLASMGAILGGSCGFNALDNPPSQVIDGKVKFDLLVGIPSVAEQIEFGIEIDPSYLHALAQGGE